MRTIRQRLINLCAGIYFRVKGNRLRQEEIAAIAGENAGESDPLLVRACAEGAVLLKNDGVLPAKKIALFGRVQTDTFFTGCGSGGDVSSPHRINVLEGVRREEGLEQDETLAALYEEWAKKYPANRGGWGNWKFSHPEMPLKEETVEEASRRSETAVVVIGRAAGEDRDAELKEGSYYLTKEERRMLRLVCNRFRKVALVLNIGAPIDFSFLDEFKIGAVLLVWQGGMETGTAAAKLLCGEISPSGRLPVTIAKSYEDYPSARHFGKLKYNEYFEDVYVGYRYFTTLARKRVRFPFGFGMSYTSFSMRAEGALSQKGGKVVVCVKNTGERSGKEVVSLYLEKPGGKIGCPARELAAFHKTGLLEAGGQEVASLIVEKRDLCVYDEARSAYVMPAGEYRLYLGGDSFTRRKVCSFRLEEEVIYKKVSPKCPPVRPLTVLDGNSVAAVRGGVCDLAGETAESIPAPYRKYGEKCTLRDVAEGKVSLADFVSTLSFEELEALSRGDYVMDSPLGAKGNAGVMGGVLPSLREKGIPPVTMTDGPSGIRMKGVCSLVPCGTALASSFSPELVREVYALMGREMKERGSDVLLAPAVNIQRNPLCGRNFEYFSEDAYLAGKIAAGAVEGLQGEGVSACVKHYACNNQENNRNRNDSRLTERALREIYLRPFEICIGDAKPHLVMTSYNKVNGVYAHYSFGLVRGILRGEWGFDGAVITDWWMRKGTCPHARKLKNNAYRIRAGVNVLMPGGGYLGIRRADGSVKRALGKKKGLALSELQRNAEEILKFILLSRPFSADEKE